MLSKNATLVEHTVFTYVAFGGIRPRVKETVFCPSMCWLSVADFIHNQRDVDTAAYYTYFPFLAPLPSSPA